MVISSRFELLSVFLDCQVVMARLQTNQPSSATTEPILKFCSVKSIGSELSLRMLAFLGAIKVMRDLQPQKYQVMNIIRYIYKYCRISGSKFVSAPTCCPVTCGTCETVSLQSRH